MEIYSRKLNIKLFGLEQNESENIRNVVMSLLNENGILVQTQDLVNVHRIPTKFKPCPVIITLANQEIKTKIWKKSKVLRVNSQVKIEDDLPMDVYKARKVLKPISFEAKRLSNLHPERRYAVKIKDDSLILNGKVYTVENLHLLPEELRPENVFTRTQGDKVAFFSKSSPLSNHYPAPIQIEGLKFSCSEHYFMLAKARAFGDEAQAKLIMGTVDPVEQKQLGSKISGFKKEVWQKKMEPVKCPQSQVSSKRRPQEVPTQNRKQTLDRSKST